MFKIITKKYLLLIIFSISINVSFPQSKNDKGKIFQNPSEVFFRFRISSEIDLHTVTRYISIDRIRDGFVYAYAGKQQFEKFIKTGISYEILDPSPESKSVTMCRSLSKLYTWNTYPTYMQYDSIMHKFATDNPSICKIVNIGSSIRGRNIYFVKIADSTGNAKNKPEFLYTSTMHGNELVGYILMLRLINYFLTNHGSNPVVDSLMKNIDIWINPLSNPDGTYAQNDSTVINSTRFNANGVDLNRNYPDPQYGLHPDGEQWQPETIAMMNFMKQHHFIMSANFHTGDEVVNYPWDTWDHVHADDAWFKRISHGYADTNVFFGSSLYPYFAGFDGGTTDGYDWYEVNGGRQDYVTYFLHGREVTIELFDQNQPDSINLNLLWKANFHSFLNYINACRYGIRGYITDSATGKPLMAMVEVLNHDIDSSQVFSDSIYGYYHRLIFTGIYTLKYSSPGYKDKIISGVNGYIDEKTILNVQLAKNQIVDYPFDAEVIPDLFNPNLTNPFIKIELDNYSEIQIYIYDNSGNTILSSDLGSFPIGSYNFPLNIKGLNSGIYYCRIRLENRVIVKKFAIIE